jgi:thioredoxin reductase
MVIVAIGQAPDVAFVGDLPGLELTSEGRVKSDPATLRTTLPGVFAGGDVASPRAGTAIGAIADGKKAASQINAYLSGQAAPAPRVFEEKVT